MIKKDDNQRQMEGKKREFASEKAENKGFPKKKKSKNLNRLLEKR
jgi:hypothetical protein